MARPCGRQNRLEKRRTDRSDGGLLRCYRPKGAFGEGSRLQQEAEAFDLQSVNQPPLPKSRRECAPCPAVWCLGLPRGAARYPGTSSVCAQSLVFSISKQLLSEISVCILSQIPKELFIGSVPRVELYARCPAPRAQRRPGPRDWSSRTPAAPAP